MTAIYAVQIGPDNFVIIEVTGISSDHKLVSIRDAMIDKLATQPDIEYSIKKETMTELDKLVRDQGASIGFVSHDAPPYACYSSQAEELDYRIQNSDVAFILHKDGSWDEFKKA